MGSMRFATVHDRTFTLTGMFGRRTVEVVNVPRGWYPKSVRYRDKDITDVPTEFKAGSEPAVVEILLSTRGAVVSGRVVDDQGNPMSRGRVVMFPAEPSSWGSDQLASVAVSKAGTFEIGPQRGGEYLIIALDPTMDPPQPGERDELARLAETAERVTLRDEEHQTIDLRLVGRQ
jgi:hypothetical protein